MRKAALFLGLLLLSSTAAAATWAQFVLGGGYESVLMASNKTAFPWSGYVKLLQGYNSGWTGRWYINGVEYSGSTGYVVAIPPYGTVKLLFTGDTTMRTGYMDFNADSYSYSSDVAYSFFYNLRTDGGDLTETVGGPESASAKKLMFGVEKSAKVDTGYAICPYSRYSTSSFQMVLTLYNADGTIYASKPWTFIAQHAIFASQVFDLPQNFVGFLKVDSQQYIYMTVLRMEYNSTGWQFTCIPPDDYVIF